MKNLKYFLGLFALVLVMLSCSTTQRIEDGEYDPSNTRVIGNRIYVDDPNYGNIVLERDPVTGRYYDVTYGPRTFIGYSFPYAGWRRNYGAYHQPYASTPHYQQHAPVQHLTPKQSPQARQETRDRVLGKRQ